MNAPPTVRLTSRVIVLDARDRVLLFRAEGTFDDGETVMWFPPGGGLEAGETHEQAAIRELAEEIGLVDAPIGPCIWTRTWIGELSAGEGVVAARERYYLCRLESHEIPADHVNPDELERASTAGHRWFDIEEIATTPGLFVPRRLDALLLPILRGELPSEPRFIESIDSRARR
ncbi:MAG: NUDIX domain-containing protein [Dehalococcoidia bacterium]